MAVKSLCEKCGNVECKKQQQKIKTPTIVVVCPDYKPEQKEF